MRPCVSGRGPDALCLAPHAGGNLNDRAFAEEASQAADEAADAAVAREVEWVAEEIHNWVVRRTAQGPARRRQRPGRLPSLLACLRARPGPSADLAAALTPLRLPAQFENLRHKRPTWRRRPQRLGGMFSGYGCSPALVTGVLARARAAMDVATPPRPMEQAAAPPPPSLGSDPTTSTSTTIAPS